MSEAEKARAFARRYAAATEALLREGVPEDVARAEARHAAIVYLSELDAVGTPTYDPARGPCPTCGRG